MRPVRLSIGFVAVVVAACGGAPPPAQYGVEPSLPEPQRGLLPDMKVSKPSPWGDARPTVPDGYRIEAIATGLKVPRQTLVLPNGDILVAEGSGGDDAPPLRPKDFIAAYIKKKGKSSVTSGRSPDSAARCRWRWHLRDSRRLRRDLNAPYGLALIGSACTSRTRMPSSASSTGAVRRARARRR